jgi:hypothetical protein
MRRRDRQVARTTAGEILRVRRRAHRSPLGRI